MSGRRRSPALLALLALGIGAVLSACGGGSEATQTATPEPRAARGVIVQVTAADLPGGFEEINFYHDIPGLLLGSSDPVLSGLGDLAQGEGRSAGQGFANGETGELLFVITIALNSAADAQSAIGYVAEQPASTIFELVSPDEQLFESERLPDPAVGQGAVRYRLRYGVETGGQRTRDVASDLVIFVSDGSLMFVLRSVPTAEDSGSGGERVNLAALSATIGDRIHAAGATEAAAAPAS